MEDLNPTKREEEFLRGIKLAASGEDSSVPTPAWDYEKRLYDIWLAAKGEDPIYNLPVRTEHPDAFYNAIRDALVEGGGGGGGGGITPTGTINITENGTVDVTEYATANVNVSGGSSAAVQKRDVNFYDYDGTVVASYTASEFASLTEMPANPSHEGLTAQGWNWSLADAKAQVAASGKCDIGQMYVSSDGKTRLYIHIADIARNKPTLRWWQTFGNGSVEIDWGDGSEPYITSVTGGNSATHTYEAVGDYIITIYPQTGNLQLSEYIFGNGDWDKVYSNCLKKVVLGNMATIGSYVFQSCYSLESVTIPSGVTSIGSSAFLNCYSLKKVTIPSSVTSIGANAFSNCQPLARVTIPSSVTSIGNTAFLSCYGVAEYHVKATTPPTAGTTIFKNLASDCKIYVPSASVDAYKAASGWSTYASQIYGE